MNKIILSIFVLVTLFVGCNNGNKNKVSSSLPYTPVSPSKLQQRNEYINNALRNSLIELQDRRPVSNIQRKNPTPDDAYYEGYDNGCEQGNYDGKRGYSQGYSYDDSSNYYDYYEERYQEGYEEGYYEGYSRGISQYEQYSDDADYDENEDYEDF